jgi:hypothetical protein
MTPSRNPGQPALLKLVKDCETYRAEGPSSMDDLAHRPWVDAGRTRKTRTVLKNAGIPLRDFVVRLGSGLPLPDSTSSSAAGSTNAAGRSGRRNFSFESRPASSSASASGRSRSRPRASTRATARQALPCPSRPRRSLNSTRPGRSRSCPMHIYNDQRDVPGQL